jgi:putative ATP-dependent endonuclease of the OLD family
LTLISRRFEEVVRSVNVVFQQGPAGIELGLEALSDGQQSLFYFALAAAVFDLERDAVAGKIRGFDTEGLLIPTLSIFAIEEPENHLSPFYLARIVRQSFARRAQPCRAGGSPPLPMRPEDKIDVHNSHRSAKGQSRSFEIRARRQAGLSRTLFRKVCHTRRRRLERVVLPRLAQAEGLLIDPAFVAIVPLGGRHVQHFWRLLNGLGIPHATLRDLDIGRKGGGFGRVKTAIEQLIAVGVDSKQLLETNNGVLTTKEFAEMHT